MLGMHMDLVVLEELLDELVELVLVVLVVLFELVVICIPYAMGGTWH